MKYVDEFRDLELAQNLSVQIKMATTKPWKIMEVCGGQTHSILQYGLEELLPSNIELLHGPGCPVCVTPIEVINKAIMIANSINTIFCSFGDMLRVPGSEGDLLQAKAEGADIRTVYSPLDALKIALKNPDKRVVFFAVGFETTAPANAMAAYQAKKMGIKNFFLLCSHVAVPPVIRAILNSPDNQVQGFLGPGHVCSVMGWEKYKQLSEEYNIPIVITGFEPLDILSGILLCVKQLEKGLTSAINQYRRAVSLNGNLQAQNILEDVFEESDRHWRGLGAIPMSGYSLSKRYIEYDAEKVFDLESISIEESPLCISGEILKGLKKPWQCSEFGKVCTPEHPLGATMVSSEGTCATYYKFGRKQALSQSVKVD